MNKQTETYITLKPIAERFSNIANEITDEEIKDLIKSCMREKIAEVIDFNGITQIVDEFVSNNEENIAEAIKFSLSKKLDLTSNYRWDTR